MPIGSSGVRIGLSETVGGRGGNVPFIFKLIGVVVAVLCLYHMGSGRSASDPFAAMHAADRDCPNDGSHNLIRDANDEDKWVCVAE